jgi:hypothetical protein
VVITDRRRRGEVAPVEFYSSLEEGVPKRVALAVFGFLQRRVFPRKETPIFYPEMLMCKIYILRFLLS